MEQEIKELELVTETETENTPAVVEPKVSRRGKAPRSLEELENISAKNMSEAECSKYIDYCRDIITQLRNQLRTLQESFTGLQKQKTTAEDNLQRYRRAASQQLQFCKDTIAQAYKAMHYMAPLEEN